MYRVHRSMVKFLADGEEQGHIVLCRMRRKEVVSAALKQGNNEGGGGGP